MISQPLRFRPILKTLVWGGDKIAAFKGIQSDSSHIGESWELSAIKGSETVVVEGEYAGLDIPKLSALFGEDFLGKHVVEKYGCEFPLLVKFIDAASDLSVQVHPDDALASQRYGKRGKSELWYVLEAAEGARLLSGLSKEFSKERYDQIAGGPEIMDYLCQHTVSEGDVFFLPAGRIHSIGKGCFVLEIQQSSDITYRIYDYGRPGLDGRPRELHTAEARDAIDYRLYPDYKLDYQRTENQENVLVSCPHFTSSFFKLTRTVTKSVCELDSFVIAFCAEGEGSVNGLAVRAGESLLVPACAERLVMSPGSRGMTILTANC